MLLGSQYLLRFGGFMYKMPVLFLFTELANFTMGPVLLFYYRQIFISPKKTGHYWHFLAPIVFILFFLIYHVAIPGEITPQRYLNREIHASLVAATSCSLFAYSFLIYREIKSYQHKFKNIYLNVDFWLYLLLGFLAIKGVEGVFVVIKKLFFNNQTVAFNSFYHVFFITTEGLLLLAVGYYGLRESNAYRLESLVNDALLPRQDENSTTTSNPGMDGEIMAMQGQNHDTLIAVSKTTVSRQRELVSREDADIFLQKLSDVMEKEKLFTNPDLNEHLLAKVLKIQPYQLSIILNKYLGMTFSQFLNVNRVNEAKRMLTDPKSANNKMFSIALDCGFNSESVFYTNFKKLTGFTPRQFQKNASMNLNQN
jgi:AraC-like DNA-binding protein